VKYRIPAGIAAGTLYFTVADGAQTSLTELRQVVAETPHTPEQVLSNVEKVHSADQAWVRVWTADPSYQVQGEEVPNPPPSMALVLTGLQSTPQVKNSKIAEMAMDSGGMAVSGTKTVQLEVKE
jgi:hypothetical protein